MLFVDVVVARLAGSFRLKPGRALALGHTAAANLPVCNDSRRFEKRAIDGLTGVADREVQCEKDAADGYAWQEKGRAALDAMYLTAAEADALFLTPAEGHAAYLTPAGVMAAYGGAAAPTDWLLCDGSAVNRTTFAALFTAIGTTYGAGNGTTTFNVPNAKGRVLAGFDAAQTEFDTLGETGGAKTHTLTAGETGIPAHGHAHSLGTGTDSPDHSHVYVRGAYSGVGAATQGGGGVTRLQSISDVSFAASSGGASARHTHAITGGVTNHAGTAATAHTNLQPSLTIQFIIKT